MQRSTTSSFTPFTPAPKEVRPIKRRVALLQAAVVGAGSHTPPALATMTAVFGVRGHVQAMVRAFETGKVNPGSKAAQRGVREGDVISSINGQATRHITNSEAHGLLKSAGHTLQLGLNEESSGSPKRRAFRGQHQQQDSRSTESIKRSSSVSSTGSAGSSASVKTTVTVNGSASEANNTATPAAFTATTDATGPTVNGSSVGETKKETSQQNGSVTKEVTIITSTDIHTSTDAKERRDSEPSSNSSASAAGDADAAQRLLPEAGATDEDTPRRRQQKRGNAHGGATGTAKGVGTTTSTLRPQAKANDIDAQSRHGDEAKNYSFKRIRDDAGAESPDDSTTTPEANDTPPVGRRKRHCLPTPEQEPGTTSESSSTNILRGNNDSETLTTGSLASGKGMSEEKEYENPDSVAFRGKEKHIKTPTAPGAPVNPPSVGRRRKQMTDKQTQGQSSELLTPKILTRSRSGDVTSTPEDSSTPDVASPAVGRRSKLNRPENTKTSSARAQDLESSKKEANGPESLALHQTSGRRRRPINTESQPSESSNVPKIDVVDMSAYGYIGKPSEDVLSPEASTESGSGTGGMGSGGGDEDESGGSTVLSRAKRRRLRAQRARRRSEVTIADTQGKTNIDSSGKIQVETILRDEDIHNSSVVESTTKTSHIYCENSTTDETTNKDNTIVSNRPRGQRIKKNSSISIDTNDSVSSSAELKHSSEIHSGVVNKERNFTEDFQREMKVSATHQEGNQQHSEYIVRQQMKRFVRRSTTCEVNDIQSTEKSELEDASQRIILSSSETVDASVTRVCKRKTRTMSSKQEIVQDPGIKSELESKLMCIAAPKDINSYAKECKQELLVQAEGMGNEKNIHGSEDTIFEKSATNNKNEEISRGHTEDMIKQNNPNLMTIEDEKESSFNSVNENTQIGFEEIITTEKDKNECQEAKQETNASGEDMMKKVEDQVTCRRRKVVRMASQEELLDAVEEVSGLCVSADAGCVLPATSVQAGVGSGRDSRVFEEVLVAPFVIQDDSVSSSTKNIPSLCYAPSTNVSSDVIHSPCVLDELAENTLFSKQKDEVEGNIHFQSTVSNIDNPLIGKDSEENIKYLPDSISNKTEPIENSNNSTQACEKDIMEEATHPFEVQDNIPHTEVTMKHNNGAVSDSVISERNDWKQFEDRWKKNLTKISHELEHKVLAKGPLPTSSNGTLVENHSISSEKFDVGIPPQGKSVTRILEQDVRTASSLDTPGTLCDADGSEDPVSLPVLKDCEERRETCLSIVNDTSSKSLPEVQSDATIYSREIQCHQESIETEFSPLVTHEDKCAPGTLKSSHIDELDISVNISHVTEHLLLSENSCISNITNNEINTSQRTTSDTTPDASSDSTSKSEERPVAQEKKEISETVVSEVKEIESSLSVESLILVSDRERQVFPETEQSLAHPGEEKVGVNYRGDAAITLAEMGNQLCLAHSSKKDDDAAAGTETVAMKVVTATAARGVDAAEKAGDGEAADGGGGAARRPSVSRNVRRGGIDVSVQRADGNDYASVPSATVDGVFGMDDGEEGNVTERALVTEQRGQFTVFTLGSSNSSIKCAPEIQVTLAEDIREEDKLIEGCNSIDSSKEFDNSSSSVAIARLIESDEIWEETQELVIIEYDPDNPPNEELLDSTDLVRTNTIPVQRDEGDEEFEDAEEGYYEEEDERELTEEEVDLLDARPAMPPEEEESLRCFLRTLQLVETPDKPRRTSLEESEEVAAIRKASKKRVSDAAAEYYAQFFPPSRCLDVIVEETSDVSDNERKNESASAVSSLSASSGHPQVITVGKNVAEVDSGDVQSPEEEDEFFQEAEEEEEEEVEEEEVDKAEEGEDTKTVTVTSTSTSSVHVTENDGFCVRHVFEQRSWLRTGVSDQERPRVVISEAEDVMSGSDSPGPEQRVELPDSSCLTSPASNEEPEEVTWARGRASAPQTAVEVVFLEDDSASEAASASFGGGAPEDELEVPLREAAAEHIGRIVRMAQTVEVMTYELEGDSGSEGEAVEEAATVTPRESDNARQEHTSSVEDDETPQRQTSDTSQHDSVPSNEVTATFSEDGTDDKKEEKIEKTESQDSEERTKLNTENIDNIEKDQVFSECQEVQEDKGNISTQQTPDSVHTDSIESAPTETLDGVASISNDSFEVINVTVLATKDNLNKESEKVRETELVSLGDVKISLDDVARVDESIIAIKENEITIKTLDGVELLTMVFNENTHEAKETSITNAGISENENNNKEETRESECGNLGESVTSFIEPDAPEDKKTLNKEESFSKLHRKFCSEVMEFEDNDRDVNKLADEISSVTETSISTEEIENMKRLRKEVVESLAKRKAEIHNEDELTSFMTVPESSVSSSDISEAPTCRVGFARGAGLCYINLPPQKPQVSFTPPSPKESQSAPNVSEVLRTDKDFVQKLMHQDLNSSSVYSVLSSLTLAQVASLSPELKHNLEALMGLKSRSSCEVEEVRNESPLLAPNHSHQCSSSSDSTSHNTALFNPSISRTSSPFADVSVSCDDHETPGEGRTPLPLDTPPALKVLALESVLAMPRGLDILRVLGSQLVKKQVPPPPPARRYPPASRGQQLASISRIAGTLPGVSSPLPPPLPTPPETWTAIPSDEDPRLLLCLSPSQMKELSLHENVSAHQLLDLHRKFSERRGYHESPPLTPPRPPPTPPRYPLWGSSGDSTPCSVCSPPPSRTDGIRAHLSPRALQRMQQQIATATASTSPRRGGRTAVAMPIPGTSSPLTSSRAKIPASERLPAILRGSALGAADSSPPTPLSSEMLKFVRRPDGSATPDSIVQDLNPDSRPQMQRATSWFGDEDPNRAARLKAQLLSEWLTLARSSAPCSRSSTPAPGGVASPSSPTPGGRIAKRTEEKEGYRRLTEQLSSLSKQLEEHRAHKKRFSLPPDAQRTQQVREDTRPMNGGAMRGGATTLPPMSPRMSQLCDGVDETLKKDAASEQRKNGAQKETCIAKGIDSAEGLQSPSQDEEEQLIRQLQRQESSQEESDPVLPPASTSRRFDADQYVISKQGDIAVLQSDTPPSGPRSTRPQALSAPATPTAPTDGELFRQQMYEEYMHKVGERAERRRHRVIRISTRSDEGTASNAAPGPLSPPATAPPPHLEIEFLGRVRERMDKLGLRYDSEHTSAVAAVVADEAGAGETAYVIEAGDGSALQAEVVQALPKHLREILLLPSDSDTEGPAMIAPRFKATSPVPGVWTPGAKASTAANVSDGESTSQHHPQQQPSSSSSVSHQDAIPPSSQVAPSGSVWTPRSASASPVAERREFRPVKFESPTLQRKNRTASASPAPKPPTLDTEARSTSAASTPPASSASTSGPFPPWEVDISAATAAANTIEAQRQQLEQLQQASAAALLSSRLVQSQSAPASGLSGLAATSQRLPRAQNPTITLLQKAREGQLPRGAHYLDRMNSRENDKDLQLGQNDIMYSVKKEYQKETETGSKKVVELTPRKFEGIGPTTTEGIPIVLRSEIKEPNQAKWYKQMYDSLHKSGKDDDYITIRYKPRRGHYPYTSAGGYLSEPEPLGYDSDIGFTAKYATLDRRRIKNKENDFTTSTLPRSKYLPHSAAIKYGTDIYKNQPGRIEDYEPGRSSISDKETKQWWDEVLDIFDGAQSEQKMIPSVSSGKPLMSYALKESGYESDSTLVFKRRDENLQNQLSPEQQKLAYKTIQRGGEVPLHGLRKPAPERPKESPHRYVESEVTIHYRSPVRAEQKEVLPEEELARRQAEAMRRIYQEERRRKYLQELQDMQSRRHTDNFTPSQKSPIPLNRYDDILDDLSTKHKTRDRTPEPKLVARALYNFVGQTSRELSFRRGDIIFVRRQIDKNWYEGEHNAMVGLFPLNYVEIIPYDGIRTMPKRPTEGQARAKFNFVAQTHLELSLVKGELVVLTRRVDENWYEGRIGNKKGIFPVSYVEVLSEPGERAVTPSSTSNKPVSSTTSRSLLTNGSSTKQTYQTYQSQQTPASSYYNRLGTSYTANNPYATMPRQGQTGRSNMAPMTQTLHIDTHSEPVPYRALYNYRPQNEDELELVEGDTVYVMEKCDDGWYVGSSQRTGFFGTFPGNYVERL